jgi:hypothetical protein
MPNSRDNYYWRVPRRLRDRGYFTADGEYQIQFELER